MHTRPRALSLLLAALLLCAMAPAALAADPPKPDTKYIGVASQNVTVRAEMSTDAESVGYIHKDDRVYVESYEPAWLEVVIVKDETEIHGYVPRHIIWDIYEPDPATPAYGVYPAAYVCKVAEDSVLYTEMDRDSKAICAVPEGSQMAILSIEGGWAKVIASRQFAYLYLDVAEDLTPVYSADDAASGDILAAYVSFYSTVDTGLNPNRMLNIDVGCEYISIPIEPGEEFSFNGIAGPYRKTRGYLEAPSFVAGETVPSYGGGTCQISSTLYNVLLPLRGGITVTYRRPHGPSGAKYLPHGVDAAVGNETLDLRFRNDFDFVVEIGAYPLGGVLYIEMRKG